MTRPGVHQITLPIPFPLQQVHCYLVETGAGWLLVDAGFPSEEARHGLDEAIRRLVGGWDSVVGVIVSHFHPDHSGLAGWIQQQAEIPVYIHEKDFEQLQSMRGMMDEGRSPMDSGPFASLPRDSQPEWERMRETHEPFASLAIEPTLVQGGETLNIDGRELELIWTPGHTEGHLCIYDRADDLLFTGDHLLQRITPHIGLWSPGDVNPLIQFEESCRLVEKLNPGYALPAHEADVERPAERSMEIREHHQTRRVEFLDAVASGADTGYKISRVVFARRTEPMQQFMALSETLAHLDALVVEDRLTRSEDEDPIYALV